VEGAVCELTFVTLSPTEKRAKESLTLAGLVY